MNDKLFTLIVFIVAYLLIIFAKKNNLLIVAAACALLFLKRIVLISHIPSIINFNVIGIFVGTMTISVFFSDSKVPDLIARGIVSRSKRVWQAMLFICALAGAISTFMENVIVVFLMAPIAFEIAKKIKASPVPFLIGIAVSSNLQGTAMMIGDSPSMILASYAGLNFMDFFWMRPSLTSHKFGLPGIAFAVELGAIAAFIVLYFLFRKNTHALSADIYRHDPIKIKTKIPSIAIGVMIAILAAASFFKDRPILLQPGSICLACGLTVFACNVRRRWIPIRQFFKECDWNTLLFLVGVFILVGSLTVTGVVDDIAAMIVRVTGSNPFLVYSFLVWFSVFASSFIDNIPYSLAIIPIIFTISRTIGVSAYPLLFGAFIGTCIGGNITPIGAQANIAAVGFLRKHGYKVGFFDFIKIGLPFTVTAVTVAYLFIWVVWR